MQGFHKSAINTPYRFNPRRAWWVLAGLCLAGCHSVAIPDPNNPATAGPRAVAVLQKDLKNASDTINDRVDRGEITTEAGNQILAHYADSELARANLKVIPADQLGELARIEITAHHWQRASALLAERVKQPDSEHNRIVDSLELARCDAELGHINQAISLTRSTFSAPPQEKWPILYKTYLEIVPAALKHSTGREMDLARLVEDAIRQHELAVGNPAVEPDNSLIAARAFHIQQAWKLIAKIYHSASKADLEKEALTRAAETAHAIGV